MDIWIKETNVRLEREQVLGKPLRVHRMSLDRSPTIVEGVPK